MSENGWKTVDPHEVQKRARQQREDATTSANVGGVAMPFAKVLRPAIPVVEKPTKKRK